MTPPPQGAVRDINELTTSIENISPDDILNRTSADGSMKEVVQKPPTQLDDISQRLQMQDQPKRKEIPGEEARNLTNTKLQLAGSTYTDMLPFEIQKLKLDEQFKTDSPVKSRSRSVSQTSSQSNSSTGSVKSVIKKTDGQITHSVRSIGGNNQSKTKEKKRSHRKEKQETQKISSHPLGVSLRSSVNAQEFEAFYKHPGRISSLRRSSFGDSSSASSLEKMTQFIALAINEDPDEIRKKLAAVEKNRAKVKNKKKQSPSSEVTSAASESGPSGFSPLASSSPQATTSPERMTYSQGSQGSHNISDSPNGMSSYTMENSVFQTEGSVSMVPLSLKELDSKDLTTKQDESVPSPKTGPFVHIIPQFGDTYTLRRGNKVAEQQQHVPVVDPRKQRTNEIEQKLNRSLPQITDSPALYDRDFSYPLPTGQLHPLPQEMNTSRYHSSPLRQRLETSDSAVGSMSTALTQDTTNNRHSWPETTPSRQRKQKDFLQLDSDRQNTSQPSNSTTADGLKTRTAPMNKLQAAAHLGSTSEGPPSAVLLHRHQAGNFMTEDFLQMFPPLSIAPGIASFGNPNLVPHLYSNNINGSMGVPGMIGPILAGSGLNVQTGGGLSHTAPTAYDPRMVAQGSAVYPPQGLGSINTFHGRVPFVQTVSASVGPKPSSLTPTYVQSLSVDIPHGLASQQIPLHLQSNSSNLPVLPTSFTQTRVSTAIPYQHTPPQQIPNGLLQVRPDFSQGAAMPPSTQVIIPGEIKFPQFCCVGVLTETVIPLHNSSSRWMHCEIRSILSTANGVQVRVVK